VAKEASSTVFRTTRLACIGVSAVAAAGLLVSGFGGLLGLGPVVTVVGVVVGLAAVGAGLALALPVVGRLERVWRCVAQRRPAQARCEGRDVASVLGRQIAETLTEAVKQAEEAREQQEVLALEAQLLCRQREASEQVLYRIPDAVVVVDGFGRVVVANAAAERVFGFKAESARGKPAAEQVGHAEFAALLERSRQSRVPCVKHELTVGQGEAMRTFDCVISCVDDAQGQVGSVVAVLHDMTREKEISQAKNDFVSHVSHELKTPLASINAYAEMLVDGEAQDEEAIRQFCGIIQSQAQRLNRLIEDILNISRIESGLVKVQKERLSVAMLIREAVEMIRSYAQEKAITVETQPAILYDQVYADKSMLQQVIVNLLSNAVKYTPQGGTVRISSEVNEADGLIRVTVEDTGVGIPPEDVEHVFDKFYRVEANKTVAKGTGLGLNLVKQIVERVHGGTVFVESTVGEGSTFGFTLPLGAAEPVGARP